MTPAEINKAVRANLRDHGRLAVDVDTIDDGFDLYKAGLSSHATVNLMLGLEETFDVEFPDAMLRRRVFESVGKIVGAIQELVGDRGGAGVNG